MKLLFDQNLSPRIVIRLNDLFPGSDHGQSVGLARASDDEIWNFAKSHGFVIVTEDEDFNDSNVVRGSPPKVTWLQIGNCTTSQVEAIFRDRFAVIQAFELEDWSSTLLLG